MRERNLSLCCGIFLQGGLHVLLFTDSLSGILIQKVLYGDLKSTSLSWGKRTWWRNLFLHVLQEVIVQSNKASFLIYHSNFLSYFGDVNTCVRFSLTQSGDSFALKMELIYIRLLHLLFKSKLPCCPTLKQMCVLLPVMCPHSDLGRTITIILVFLYVSLQNVNG